MITAVYTGVVAVGDNLLHKFEEVHDNVVTGRRWILPELPDRKCEIGRVYHMRSQDGQVLPGAEDAGIYGNPQFLQEWRLTDRAVRLGRSKLQTFCKRVGGPLQVFVKQESHALRRLIDSAETEEEKAVVIAAITKELGFW